MSEHTLPSDLHSHLKVAIVYDWVTTQFGGAEQVLMALHQTFPDAPLYTSVYDLHQATWAKNWEVRSSFLQKIPGAIKHYRYFAPLMPLAFESFQLDAYDVVISVTSFAAKGVLTKPGQLHVCYMLTPPRFLYSHPESYWSGSWFKKIGRWLAQPLLTYLKKWDQVATLRPDRIIPISRIVQSRVSSIYKIIPEAPLWPPVEPFPKPKPNAKSVMKPGTALVISRLVTYKRIDLAIKACHELAMPLTVIGDGPAYPELVALANKLGSQTYFLGKQPDDVVAQAVSEAGVLLMPGIEDFGITAVAAAASGLPVILHQESGAAEAITDGTNGLKIQSETVSEVVKALRKWQSLTWDKKSVQQDLHWYDTTNFCTQFSRTVKDWWQSYKKAYNTDSRF